jgi:hypothetical protein
MPSSITQNDDDTSYGVKYSGNILDGFTIKTSTILLQQNAKMNIETIKKLISLRDEIIKKNISLESANNLTRVLRECGLDCNCISMQQGIEQRKINDVTNTLLRMSNDDIHNLLLSLGNNRAKEIAFAVMKETTKDSFDSIKKNAEEKITSFLQSSKKMISENEKSTHPTTNHSEAISHTEDSNSKKERAYSIFKKNNASYGFFGPKFTKPLNNQEKFACFSWLGFFFGIWAYLFTGLWRKTLMVLALAFLLPVVNIVLNAFVMATFFEIILEYPFILMLPMVTIIVVAVYLQYTLGKSYLYDRYRKDILRKNFWW